MLQKILLYCAFAGSTVFIGGVLANYFNQHVKKSPFKDEVIHTMMAFGAGIILAAFALVLIPKGMEELELIPMSLSFIGGALVFMFTERYFERKGGQTATLMAMVMDFIPESLALGAVVAIEPATAALLAVFIGLQNLPEAFNSFRDLVQSGFTVRKTLTIFFFISFFGLFSALIGYYFLSDYQVLTAHLMVFASGGILYLLIQSIIPQSKLKNNYMTSLGATLGFLAGIIGEKLI